MNQHAETRLPTIQNLLDTTQISEGAGTIGGHSAYEPSIFQSYSNGLRKSTVNTQSRSQSRSTAQFSRPGQPMPAILSTTPVGSMPSPGGSSLANNVSSAEASYEHQVTENARLRLTGSHLAIDAAGGSPVPTSTAARSHSQPSVASLEAHFHPLHAAISPQDVQDIQNTSADHPDMHSYLGTAPSENAAPSWQERPFQPHKEIIFMTLPGSDDPISVSIDAQGSSKAQERRDRNAEASRRHREKKRKLILADLSEEVGQLRMEMKGMGERMWRMEEEQNLCQEFIRNLFKQVPWLGHWVQRPDFLSQTSNTVVRMSDPVASPQSYGRGGSWGEQPSKRRQANQVPEFSTPAYRGFVNQPTGIRSELPPKQNLQDTSTRWDVSQSAEVSAPATMVASLR